MNELEIEKKYKITKEIYTNIINFFNGENLKGRIEKQNDLFKRSI